MHAKAKCEGLVAITEAADEDVSSFNDSDSVSTWQIDANTITVSDARIGSGVYGCLYLATYNGMGVVVKRMKADEEESDDDGLSRLSSTRSQMTTTRNESTEAKRAEIINMFMREATIWFSFDSPHVVKLYGACSQCFPPMFVCEYAPEGSLDKYLSSHPTEIWRMLYEVALAV